MYVYKYRRICSIGVTSSNDISNGNSSSITNGNNTSNNGIISVIVKLLKYRRSKCISS